MDGGAEETTSCDGALVQEWKLTQFAPLVLGITCVYIGLRKHHLHRTVAAFAWIHILCTSLHLDPATVRVCARCIVAGADAPNSELLTSTNVVDTVTNAAALHVADRRASVSSDTGAVSVLDPADAPPYEEVDCLDVGAHSLVRHRWCRNVNARINTYASATERAVAPPRANLLNVGVHVDEDPVVTLLRSMRLRSRPQSAPDVRAAAAIMERDDALARGLFETEDAPTGAAASTISASSSPAHVYRRARASWAHSEAGSDAGSLLEMTFPVAAGVQVAANSAQSRTYVSVSTSSTQALMHDMVVRGSGALEDVHAALERAARPCAPTFSHPAPAFSCSEAATVLPGSTGESPWLTSTGAEAAPPAVITQRIPDNNSIIVDEDGDRVPTIRARSSSDTGSEGGASISLSTSVHAVASPGPRRQPALLQALPSAAGAPELSMTAATADAAAQPPDAPIRARMHGGRRVVAHDGTAAPARRTTHESSSTLARAGDHGRDRDDSDGDTSCLATSI